MSSPPKGPSPNTITLGVGASTHEFGGDKIESITKENVFFLMGELSHAEKSQFRENIEYLSKRKIIEDIQQKSE